MNEQTINIIESSKSSDLRVRFTGAGATKERDLGTEGSQMHPKEAV